MSQLRLLGEPPAPGGGVTDHPLLTNLGFATAGHTGFVASAGIAGGQTIIGGNAAGEHVTLQSTAHATRGYVRAQDDLQLLSNILRDSAGTRRLSLAGASPYVTLGDPAASGGGDTLIWGKLGLGNATPAIDANAILNVKGAGGTQTAACLIQQGLTTTVPAGEAWGIGGLCNLSGTGNLVAGLRFNAYHSGATGTLAALEAIRAGIWFASINAAIVTSGAGLRVLRPYSIFASNSRRADTQYGIVIEDQFSLFGINTPTTVGGLKIDDASGGTSRPLLDLGPATPYLRLVGGAAPGAGLTNLYLNEGGTLRRVQWKDGATIAAGDRVMVLV